MYRGLSIGFFLTPFISSRGPSCRGSSQPKFQTGCKAAMPLDACYSAVPWRWGLAERGLLVGPCSGLGGFSGLESKGIYKYYVYI